MTMKKRISNSSRQIREGNMCGQHVFKIYNSLNLIVREATIFEKKPSKMMSIASEYSISIEYQNTRKRNPNI